jgi:SlyX protein
MSEHRLVDIETKIAFQEKSLKELNDVMYDQQREIERLNSICDLLVKRVRDLSDFIPGSDGPANEKPPHY